jgi:hypothetical protein
LSRRLVGVYNHRHTLASPSPPLLLLFFLCFMLSLFSKNGILSTSKQRKDFPNVLKLFHALANRKAFAPFKVLVEVFVYLSFWSRVIWCCGSLDRASRQKTIRMLSR